MKLIEQMESAISDACRKTGNVTHDGASECAAAAVTAIMCVLLTDEDFKQDLDDLNTLLNTAAPATKQKPSKEKAKVSKKTQDSFTRLRHRVSYLRTELARSRLLNIRDEIEATGRSLREVESMNNRGLITDRAFSESKVLHRQRTKNLEKERDVLYEQFPDLLDMQKAD